MPSSVVDMNPEQWRHHKLLNKLQAALLIAVLAGLLGLLGWILGGADAAWAAVMVAIASYYFNPLLSPHWVLHLYQGRHLLPAEAPQLYQLTRALAERAGLPRTPVLYYLPTPVLNAFATSGGRVSVIGLSNGLLRHLTLEELAGVLAHEISHLRHQDLRLMSFADLLTRLTHWLSLAGQWLLLLSLPLLFLGAYQLNWLLVLILIFAPSLSALLQLALSRSREFNADLGAAELLGTPLPLAAALSKMARYQSGQERSLFWPRRRVAEPSLLRTHPDSAERIRRLLDLQAQNPVVIFPSPYAQQKADYPFLNVPPQRARRRFISGLWY